MKLVYANGVQRDREVEVSGPGVSFGREEDNDIVVNDEAASRYHAKVAPTDSGWEVKDLDSSNGVYLNDKKVDGSAPLQDRDKIRIGAQEFIARGIGTAAPSDGTVSVSAPEPVDSDAPVVITVPADSAPSSFGDDEPAEVASEEAPAEKSADADAARRRRLLALTLALIVAVVVVGGLLLVPPAEPPKPVQPMENKNAPLNATFVKLTATQGKVFRYELRLVGNDVTEGPEPISASRAKKLRDDLLAPALMRLSPMAPQQKHDRLERSMLVVQAGRKGNAIDVVNDIIPPPMEEAIMALEELAEDTFGFIAIPLTREEVMERASSLFTFAERAFAEQHVERGNLFRAEKAYRDVSVYLKGFSDRPEIYEQAYRKQIEAEELLNKTLKDHEFAARVALKVDEYQNALEHLHIIIDMMPDEGQQDDRVRRARNKMHEINVKLEKLKKMKR
jgi:pSer/pThr/pTyr-binding forkhead associated (FHA) protein